MTLIASLVIEDYPVLLGDLLLSTEESDQDISNVTFDIPSLGNVPVSQGGYYISGLSQKLSLISDRIALGWSGSHIVAKTIIKEIRQRANISTLTQEELLNILNDFSGEDDVDLIGIFLSQASFLGNTQASLFSWHSITGQTEIMESTVDKVKVLFAFGTGADYLKQIASETTLKSFSRNHTAYTKSVMSTMSLMSLLLGDQTYTRLGVNQLFGGAFESIIIIDGKLIKLDNITFINIEVTKEDNGNIKYAFGPIIKLEYLRDILLLRRTWLDNGQKFDNATSKIKNQHFAISPVYLRANRNEIKNHPSLSLESKFMCIYLIFPQAREDQPPIQCMSYFKGDGDFPITFDDREESLTIGLTEKFRSRVDSIIKEKLS